MLRSEVCLSVTVLLAYTALATLNTNCFRMSNGQIGENIGAIPCGIVTADSPNVPCCNAGSFCLADSICLAPGTPNPGFSGYYTGGCTDPTYDDPSCNPYCRSVPRADIIYNDGTKLWSCCGTEPDNITVNCNDPTSIIFSDPAPTALSTTFSVGSTAVISTSISSSISSISSVTTTSITSSTTTPSEAPSETGTGSPQPSSGLSTGAKAGIGVGAAIIGITVLIGVIFVFYRRRKRSSMQPPDYDGKTTPVEPGAVREAKRAELSTEQPIQELA